MLKRLATTDELNDIMRDMDAQLFETGLSYAERVQKACAYAYEQLMKLFRDTSKCTFLPDEAYHTIRAALDVHNGKELHVIQEGDLYCVPLKECVLLLASGGTVLGKYTNDVKGYVAYLHEQWHLVREPAEVESMACVLENLTEQEYILLEWASRARPLKMRDGTMLFTSFPMLADIEDMLEELA